MDKTQQHWILLNISIGAIIIPFTSSVMSFVVPKIAQSFNASFIEIVWVPMSFLIALPSFMMILGNLSDIYGRVGLYKLGFIIFIAGATIAAMASSIYTLIAATFVMGIGGAVFGVNSTAIISTVYSPKNRGSALGVIVMAVYVGLMLGPMLGGVLTQFFTWNAVFIINIPLALIALILSFFTMKNVITVKRVQKVDIFGAMIFTVSIFLIVLYLSLSQIYGWIVDLYLPIFGIILLIYFVISESKVKNPLFNLSLFTHNRTFAAANLAALVIYISTFAIVFIFSVYLQVIAGYSPMQSGLMLMFEPLFMVIFSPISGRLADRYGSKGIASFGLIVVALSFFLLYFLNGNTNMIDVVIPLIILGTGFGLFSAANVNSVMGAVKKQEYGIASGTLGTMRVVGQLLSLALMSSVLADAMPRKMLLQMFLGEAYKLTISDVSAFVVGFKVVMLLSGILSGIGVIISLLRSSDFVQHRKDMM